MYIKNYFFAGIMVALASCAKKPEANFSVSNANPLIDESVSFTNSSTEASTYSWDFGDGTSSFEQSPKKSYAVEGTYRVTLKVYSDGEKNWSEKSNYVIVKHPTALFTGNLNGTSTRLMAGVNGDAQTCDKTATVGGGTRSVVYKSFVGNNTTGNDYMGIELGTLAVSDTLTLTETIPYFHSLIQVQEYPFSVAAVAGVRIFYRASNGVMWSTDNGAANQSSSNFIITYTSNGTSGANEIERFKAHFNCTLYNGLGQSITVTNGVFELDFANL